MRDIRSLDLNLLKALDALLDERNVTRAATRLGLTQPAVSGMLTRMREALGDPLFLRSQRGIIPTLRAQELAAPVKRVLQDIDALLRPACFAPHSAEFTLTVAATDYALHAIMVPFLATLRRQAPGIRVAVRPLHHERVATHLATGEIDLALMTPDTAPPEAHSAHLYHETYVVALRDGHPDAAGTLSLDRFCALDHALVSLSGHNFRGVTDDALAELGRARRVVLAVGSFLVLLEVLRTSNLIAVLPRKLLHGAPGLVLRPPPVPVPGFTKLAVWHERTQRDAGQEWVRALLLQTCRDHQCELLALEQEPVQLETSMS